MKYNRIVEFALFLQKALEKVSNLFMYVCMVIFFKNNNDQLINIVPELLIFLIRPNLIYFLFFHF